MMNKIKITSIILLTIVLLNLSYALVRIEQAWVECIVLFGVVFSSISLGMFLNDKN